MIIQRKSRVLNDDYGILVKTVRFNKKGNPREDMSIDGAFRFMERGSLLEEEWESSGDDKNCKDKKNLSKTVCSREVPRWREPERPW